MSRYVSVTWPWMGEGVGRCGKVWKGVGRCWRDTLFFASMKIVLSFLSIFYLSIVRTKNSIKK